MKTDFCVCLPSSCPGLVFCLLWGSLQSLLDGHVVRLWSLSTICWVMVEWVAPLVAVANGAASTEFSSLFCELCFICVFDMYVSFMCFLCAVCPCVFLVYTHAQGCLHKWLNLKLVLIQEHISHTRAHAQYTSIGCTIHTNVAPTCSQSFSFCTTTLPP